MHILHILSSMPELNMFIISKTDTFYTGILYWATAEWPFLRIHPDIIPDEQNGWNFSAGTSILSDL